MLRELVHGLTDHRLDRSGTVRDDPAPAAFVAMLAHGDRHPAVDALGRMTWAAGLAAGALAAVLLVAAALAALLAVLPAHPTLLVAGVAAGIGLVTVLPFAVVRVVRRLLAGADSRL